MVFTAELAQFLSLGAGRTAVAALTGIALRLTDPVRDRLRRRLELTGKVFGRSTRPDQFNHLPPELQRVGHSEPGHLGHLRLKPRGVHETGSTPLGLVPLFEDGSTFDRRIAADRAQWAEVIRAANIRAD
jgi:hypothetical protein